ncbi:hypothetical protein C2845_PM01G36800 [Panicum miliaceum]|uniref:Bifunctional inhibitor/plant lipid transfer protein/seed storage helical domain-containing protein n=1 Tax=Panicum miliaceum TaxID=4540 RepID=A0A3L6TIY3_PANMI|nr:hypothetical protein C2845_PM01G36800 [Panicum miliaceum]
MASSKVLALFALLALCAASASATSFLRYTPPMMQPYPLAMLQQQRCMALMMQGIMSPECQQLGAMYPITQQMQQQRCMALMMQGIMSPECQQLGAMYPITQQMQTPVMQGVMTSRCQCGSMCSTTAMMNNPLGYPQHCVAGCSC